VVSVLATFEIKSRIAAILLLVQRAIRGSLIALFSPLLGCRLHLSTGLQELHPICQGLPTSCFQRLQVLAPSSPHFGKSCL